MNPKLSDLTAEERADLAAHVSATARNMPPNVQYGLNAANKEVSYEWAAMVKQLYGLPRRGMYACLAQSPTTVYVCTRKKGHSSAVHIAFGHAWWK